MEEARVGGIREWYLSHRRPVDALLIALLSALAAFLGFSGIWSIFSVLPADASPWWTLATALPACILVLTKHRAPWLSLIAATVVFAVDLFTTGGLGPLVVLLDVLWTAAFLASPRARRRILIAMILSVVVLFVVALLVSEASAPTAFLVAVQFGAFVGTDYWWAVAVSQANELADLHRQRAEEAAAAAVRDRAEAVLRERETMAKELHDVVAGHVLAMAIRAEAALSTPADERADRAALQAVRDAGIDAHGALRSMIAVLRRGDGELSPTPRLADVEALADDARRAGLRVRVSADGVTTLTGPTEQAVVRVVREALSNCLRHAGGAEVDVTMEERDAVIAVRVESRGGAPLVSAGYEGGGWGLSMLAERVEALGGRFSAGPHAGGWLVEAQLPARPV
ncbi:sensor histidine kinase [Microbacterium sp. MYb72]|uniref:sensor histidine kinase n=1 Tax=Microbacterium sp. MYb72 TaxID=1848693 RepID=UPI002157B15F|nr:histidine kinase [Microbacterium sp. MYb72]